MTRPQRHAILCKLLPLSWVVATPALTQTAQPPAPSSQTPPAVVELPPIVVTSPSPVTKPAAKPAAQPSPAVEPAPSAPPAAAAPQTTPPAIDLPGTVLVATEAFVPLSIATSREITAAGAATITDVLVTKPGINGTTFAPGANRPIVRGLDSYRVRTQENGIGSHDVSAISEDHAVPLSPFAADRIEVVRGPATLRYGSQAIGGVVSVENERIPAAIPRGGVAAEIQGGARSVDEGRDGGVKVTAGGNGVAVHLDAFKRSAVDYETPSGRRQLNSFAQAEGFSVGASRILDDGWFGLAYTRIDSLYGVPGEEANEGLLPRIDMGQEKLTGRGEWRVRDAGIDTVRLWLGASRYAHSEQAIENPIAGFETGSRFTNTEQEARAEIQHLPIPTYLGALDGAIGVQWGHRRTRGESFEGDSLLEPARTRSLAAFWFEELTASDTLRLQAAVRFEHASVDGLGYADVANPLAPTIFAGERAFTPLSGSIGALLRLPLASTARLTAQYVERAPDAAELFSKGIHEATGTFEIGNPALDKEKAITLEAGVSRAKGAVRFDASIYATRYSGFIYRHLTGLECEGTLASCGPPGVIVGETFDQVLFRQRDARFLGAEIAAQWDVATLGRGVWGLDAQYDFTRARFTSGENVPRIPPHRLGGGLYYRDSAWFARLGVLHAFTQDRIGVNEIETPGHTLVSLDAGTTIALDSGGALTVGVKGENLANDDVLNHASFKRREDVLAPGASVRLYGILRY